MVLCGDEFVKISIYIFVNNKKNNLFFFAFSSRASVLLRFIEKKRMLLFRN